MFPPLFDKALTNSSPARDDTALDNETDDALWLLAASEELAGNDELLWLCAELAGSSLIALPDETLDTALLLFVLLLLPLPPPQAAITLARSLLRKIESIFSFHHPLYNAY